MARATARTTRTTEEIVSTPARSTTATARTNTSSLRSTKTVASPSPPGRRYRGLSCTCGATVLPHGPDDDDSEVQEALADGIVGDVDVERQQEQDECKQALEPPPATCAQLFLQLDALTASPYIGTATAGPSQIRAAQRLRAESADSEVGQA